MNSFRQVKLLAEFLDQNGKPDQPITVIGSRAHLRREFKPESRGGPLRVGRHELQVIARAPKGQLQNMDWVPADPASENIKKGNRYSI
jgi:hypothetical protein